MKRFIRLVWVNYRSCFIRMLEFRSEAITWSIHSILWALLALTVVSLMFGQVDSIAGWTKNETLALALVCSMFNSFLWWFVYPSVLRLAEVIQTGYFDFYLLRPINSQFLASVSRFEFDNYPRVFVTVILLVGLIISEGIHVSLFSIINFALLFLFGSVIFYSLFFVIATLTIWLINMQELESLFDTLITSGRYPTYIFEGGLRLLFFFLIPIVFVATFPVQTLLGKGGFELVALGGIMAVVFLWFSVWFWNFALKRYSSASS